MKISLKKQMQKNVFMQNYNTTLLQLLQLLQFLPTTIL